MDLWHRHHGGGEQQDDQLASALRDRLRHHLRDRQLRDTENQRLLDGLGWHDDRGNVLRFLAEWSIPPTNNQAERDLRGAVIARKVSHCSKSDTGAEARSVMMRVFATLKRRGVDTIVDAFAEVIATGLLPEVTTV